MDKENGEKIKVTVILEHWKGEKYWTASVPLIKGCLAEGLTPESATDAITPEINYFLDKHPTLLEELGKQPEFLITEVEIPLERKKE